MRSIVVVAIGLVLLGICVVVSRMMWAASSRGVAIFWALWLVAAAINMWIGVSRAGYSVADEFPIFMLIFTVPAAAGLLVRWRFP